MNARLNVINTIRQSLIAGLLAVILGFSMLVTPQPAHAANTPASEATPAAKAGAAAAAGSGANGTDASTAIAAVTGGVTAAAGATSNNAGVAGVLGAAVGVADSNLPGAAAQAQTPEDFYNSPARSVGSLLADTLTPAVTTTGGSGSDATGNTLGLAASSAVSQAVGSVLQGFAAASSVVSSLVDGFVGLCLILLLWQPGQAQVFRHCLNKILPRGRILTCV